MTAQGETPTLRVLSSQGEALFTLDRPELVLGRQPDSDICIDVNVVSGVHARLVRDGATFRFIQMGQTNPTILRGTPIEEELLGHGDRLEIAPGTRDAVIMFYELPHLASDHTLLGAIAPDPDTAATTPGAERAAVPATGTLVIGRVPNSDVVLPSLHVSRMHARLTIDGGRAVISDLDSANGTFVNGVRVRSHALARGDVVRIGPYKLVFRGDSIEHIDDSRSVRLDGHDITKQVDGKLLLDHITFAAQPGEILAIAGTSGAGKSTLLDALNGMRPPTSGHVLVNGADLYRAYDALRPLIGYVPQDNILPEQLPVRRALLYVAQLRLPRDVSARDTEERMTEVMEQLDLTRRADVPIGRLSGGQQKRASIAAELIANPGLFFLDEPTSGLDPGLTLRVTEIVRGLADNGATIVIISHDVESIASSDQVLFLGSGGRVVFMGSPGEACAYFDVDNLAHIYRRVESEDSAVWRERFVASEIYREGVAPRLVRAAPVEEGMDEAEPSWDPIALIGGGARRGSSAWRQLRIQTARYIDTVLRDRAYLALLLAQAPIIAFFISVVAKATDLQPPPPEAVAQAEALGVPAAKLAAALPVMMAATATWFGSINAARELVKELPVFLRERMAGMLLGPYFVSKLIVLGALCLIQTTLLLGIVALTVDLPRSGAITWGPLELWISLSLASFAALGLGLVISASVSNANRAQSLVPIVLIPQLIFVGGPGTGIIGQWLSYLTVTHWSVEAMKITASIPYTEDAGGFGAGDLLAHWGALLLMMAVFLLLAAWQQSRRRRT